METLCIASLCVLFITLCALLQRVCASRGACCISHSDPPVLPWSTKQNDRARSMTSQATSSSPFATPSDLLNLESLVGFENKAVASACFNSCFYCFLHFGVLASEGRSQRFTDSFVTGDADDRRAVRWIRAETFPQQAWHRQGHARTVGTDSIRKHKHLAYLDARKHMQQIYANICKCCCVVLPAAFQSRDPFLCVAGKPQRMHETCRSLEGFVNVTRWMACWMTSRCFGKAMMCFFSWTQSRRSCPQIWLSIQAPKTIAINCIHS